MTIVDLKFNKLLLKQIQKKFDGEEIPPEFLDFLTTVSQAYDHYEKERQLLERSMDISSNELMEVNAKLEEQAAKLRRSNAELNEFAFAVSHDLKEPLRTIASYVQLIELRLKGELDTETKDFMKFAVSGVKRLQNMLDGMLKYAQVGDEYKDFNQPLDLNKILEATQRVLNEAITESKVNIVVLNPLPVVKGNAVQLELLFQNLISNSIKFRSQQNPVIEIGVTIRQHDYLISVSDNGIGVKGHNKQDLFTMFKRGHSTNYDGIGMGLSICKKIVENHGGNIWMDDLNEDGLRIHFNLPK